MSTSRSHEYIPPQVILTIGELSEVYETRTPEEWRNMTVREVMEAYPEYGRDIVFFLLCTYTNPKPQ